MLGRGQGREAGVRLGLCGSGLELRAGGSKRRMAEVVELTGLVGVGRAFQTNRGHLNAVAQKKRSGRPILTPTRSEMSTL